MKAWLEKLKIAVIEEDTTKLESLMDSMPHTKDIDLAHEGATLLEQALSICSEKQNKLGLEIAKFKNVQKHINSYSQ